MLKGKRKYTFALIVVILATTVLIFKRLPPEHYVSIMQAVIYGFLGANAVQAVGVKAAEKIGAKPDGNVTSQSQP